MKTTIFQEHDIIIVHFPRRVTFFNFPEVARYIEPLLDTENKLIIDLIETEFMDSVGFAYLLKLSNEVKSFSLLSPNEVLFSLMALLNIDEKLNIEHSLKHSIKYHTTE